MKKIIYALFFLWANVALSQVKVGDNINTIDAASILELESASKVFVVTRISTAQMNAISPLNGALAFNTDENCLFQYRNNDWVSLCVDISGGQTITALVDNADGTFTYSNEAGLDVVLSKASFSNNGDGTYTFTNGALTDLTIDTNASAIAYDNSTSGLLSTDIQAAIDELQASATADDDITGVTFDGTDLTVDEGATSFSADLSALEESADITALQADVDQNETDADTAIAANATAITAEETRALAAEGVIQADVDANEAAANAAIALKEDTANKSTDGTLAGNSDVDFPTEQAVKTYVDGQIAATADDDITGVTFDGTNLTVDEGATTFSADLSALEESADITAEETRALAAEAAIQADVDANETAANAAIALKEDAANKSTDGTLADNSDVDFPTEQAVKTYVDGQITATADDDITAVTFDGTDLTVDEGATTFSADLSTLEESADITALQADVDQNETDADTAIAANATAITAEETRALAAEGVIQADVDANEAAANAAIALKEDTANKSTDGTLTGNSDVDFPTEQAVKTYVDGQISTLSTLADGTIYIGDGTNTAQEVSISGDAALANTGVLTISDDAVNALKINSDIAGIGLSQNAITGALEVDAITITDVVAGNKIATITEADGTLVEIDETITSLESVLGTESTIRYTNETGSFNDISNIVRSVNGVNPAANGNVAVILSSVNTGLEVNRPLTAVDSDIYIVSGEVAPNADRNGVAFIFDDVTGWQEVTTDLSTNDARYVNVNGDAMIGPLALGDFNITDLSDPANAQDAATKNYVDNGLILKENAANKSTDGTLAGNSDVDFPTEQAVKTYVDAQITATADDDITGVSFDGTDLTVDEGATTFSADLSALEESAAISAEETRAIAAEAAIQADVDQNETDADTAIAANTTAITAEETRALAAEGVIQADVDANEAAANAAIALKEDAANKSTDGTLAGNSDVDFPTEQAVKTYVDAQITATADDDITGVSFDGTDLTVDEGATTFSADLSALEESAAISAEETRAIAAEAAIQADVDQNETDADTAIAANTTAITAEETRALAAEGVIQADVDANEAAANAAIALKEDAANKSTDGTLAGNSDVDFPTEQAVKTYVDAQITATADDDITGVSFDGTDLTVDEGATTFSADLSALEESAAISAEETRAIAAEAAIQADVDQNETDADTAIAANTTAITAEETRALAAEGVIQADVDANEAAANAAIALKEDAANKSTDGTLAGNSDVDFPTEQAVKTYVDAQITATADDDITGVSFDGTDLTVDEGATTFSADLSALEESAAISAEETRAIAAEAAIQADVDQNETDADTAIAANTTAITAEETRALAAEGVIQADVDANEAAANAAIALKEDAANKSTDGTLAGNSDVDFPTEQAVKTYVDAQITATADDDITGVSFDGTDLTVDEGATTFSADLSALEESAAISAEETRAIAAEAAIQADVDQNETDADTAIAANTTAITAEETRALAAEGVIQADVDANEAAANAAIALKEDAANKSTDGTLAGNSDVDFPTEQAVKTYVDAQITATADDDITGVSFDGTDLTVDEGATTFSADLSALEESAAISAVQNNLNTHTTADQDISDTNEIQTLTKAGNTISLSIGGGSVNETVTSIVQNTTTGVITHTDETTGTQTANVIGTETNNSITVGGNGGAFYESPIKAFGKISSAGAVTRATTGVTVTKLTGNGHYRITLPTGVTTDANYIIQLTQPGRGGAGNDDPGISYSNQTATTFEVIIGDNDNGGTDRARFNSEFMFTVIDL